MLRVMLALVSLATSSAAAADDALSCSWEQHHKNGTYLGGGVAIYFEAGHIAQLVFESESASGEEGGGYVCDYNSSSTDYHTTIVAIPGGVRFTTDIAAPNSVFEVTKSKGAYRVTSEHGNWFCGFGAEFPTVVLVPGKKTCKVSY